MKKEKFSINVAGLSDYTDELRPEMILEKFFEKRSVSQFNLQKVEAISTVALNILDSDVYWQDSACGMAESGATALLQRNLVVKPKSVRQDWCKATFYQKWASYFMNNTMSSDGGTIESQIVDNVINNVADQFEIATWQATSGGTDHYDGYSGLIEILTLSACVDVPTASSVTYANIDDSVQLMVDNIPDAMLDKEIKLYLSLSNFQTLLRKWNDDLYKYSVIQTTDGYSIKHPFLTNLTIEGIRGLNGTDSMVILDPMNVYIPVTGNDEIVDIEFSYDPDSRKHLMFIDFIVGVQVAQPEYIVTNFATA